MATILGIIGSLLAGSIAFPQAIRAFRVGVEGVSATTFQLFVVQSLLWFNYDGRSHYWVALPGISFQIGACTAVLVAIYLRHRKTSQVVPLYALGLLLFAALFA